jgi:ribonuclease HII
MPWHIGIDEAGYGPNLGPLVMTSVACHLEDGLDGSNLWDRLKSAVRRPHEPEDDRLLIEDSKLVYTPKDGLAALETGVLGTVLFPEKPRRFCLADCLCRVAPTSPAELADEPWFVGRTALPLVVKRRSLQRVAQLFGETCSVTRVRWGLVRSVIICTGRFNRLLKQWNNKAAILGQALAELLTANLSLNGDSEPAIFCIDKHGGRNNYAAMLQDAVPDGFVMAGEESAECSSYRIVGLPRDVHITIRPRADTSHFCVALASMVSKYLREALMHEFNGFWQQHVEGLKPTAGYPKDSRRFYKAIRPAIKRLGLAEQAIWRRR